jgi:hypothetical protein
MTWSVDLKGHGFDLDEWVKWLDGSKFTVSVHSGAYRLTSTLFEDLEDPNEVKCAAEELIEFGNGLGRLLWSEYQPVAVGNVQFTEEDGSEKVFLTGRDVGRARDKASADVVSSDGTLESDPSVGAIARLLPLAFDSEPIRRALLFVGREELRWNDLYRAWEVVCEDVGDKRFSRGWISRRADKRFKWTANSFTVLGLEARHGERRHPPKDPLEFCEAKALVLELVRQWVKHANTGQEATGQDDPREANSA